jgi:hypothetical protein
VKVDFGGKGWKCNLLDAGFLFSLGHRTVRRQMCKETLLDMITVLQH